MGVAQTCCASSGQGGDCGIVDLSKGKDLRSNIKRRAVVFAGLVRPCGKQNVSLVEDRNQDGATTAEISAMSRL